MPENYNFFRHIQRGIEKEGLRVTPLAAIAQTKHFPILGAPLTHSYITTDYSEALLEFITPVSTDIDYSIQLLQQLHQFTQNNIGDEYIWPTSMPCKLAGNNSIPIAQYGDSNLGQIKSIYRQGLSHRYGRIMQSIAGIHYNFSMPDGFWPHYQKLCSNHDDLSTFKSARYLGMIRNIQRNSWLLSYLFGASPVLDASFIENNQAHQLETISDNTLGLPFSTSLRMSDLGYQSKAQSSINISYNSLDKYLQDMTAAMQQSFPDYEKIECKMEGKYQQLNSNILQIENEHYSDVRPKRVLQSGEKPLAALQEKGIEYVELRLLDINPFLPVGIDELQVRFLDSFLLYCLLTESADISPQELTTIKQNQQNVVLKGRDPKLQLNISNEKMLFSQAAQQLLNAIQPMSALLDQSQQIPTQNHPNNDVKSYQHAHRAQLDKVLNSDLTPSGQIMSAINSGINFTDMMLNIAKENTIKWQKKPLSEATITQFNLLAAESIQKQHQLEASEQAPLDIFLQSY